MYHCFLLVQYALLHPSRLTYGYHYFLLFQYALLNLSRLTYGYFNNWILVLDPISLVRDHRAKEVLSAQGIAVHSFNADLLYAPWEVHDQDGCPFRTFTEFWEGCLSMPYDPESPLLPPKRIISGNDQIYIAFLLLFLLNCSGYLVLSCMLFCFIPLTNMFLAY